LHIQPDNAVGLSEAFGRGYLLGFWRPRACHFESSSCYIE
jgi:hypothetical protein